MKFAYVVDVHDRYDAVTAALADIGSLDVLIVGGDITTAGTPDDASGFQSSMARSASRLLAVAGNMDSPAIDARLVELGVSIDERGVVVGDVGFHGVSGSAYTPLSTPYELPDDELGRRAEAGHEEVKDCRIRVFCPHSPPYDTACDRLRSGRSVGSRSLRTFIERTQPDVVLCGHIHEARGEDSIGRTRIVNPGPAAVGHYAVVEVGESVTVTLD